MSKRAKTKKKRRAGLKPPTVSAVKLAAMECATMAEAAVRIDRADLAELLAARAPLAAAWTRGRLLRDLRSFAAAGVTATEAASAMNAPPGELEKMLLADAEAREVWTRARLETTIAIKQALVSQAIEGKAAAIRQIEQVLLQEIQSGRPNWRRLTAEQMSDLTGKSRQTLHDWTRKQSPPCPRNSDRTFDLRAFLQWFEGFSARKAAGGHLPQSAAAAGRLDPLKTAKAEKLEMEIASRRGELLERPAVMAGILARQQVIVNALARLPQELATLLVSQPAESIRRTLREAVAEIQRAMCEVPPQLQLPAEAARRFTELLQSLEPEGAAQAATEEALPVTEAAQPAATEDEKTNKVQTEPKPQ